MTGLEQALIGAIVALFGTLAKVVLGYRADIAAEREASTTRETLAHDAKERLRIEKDTALAEAEKKADALEKSYREHLEHDARVFRGEVDRRPIPRHETGVLDLDRRREKAENVSRNLPPELLAQVRGMIERGEIGA